MTELQNWLLPLLAGGLGFFLNWVKGRLPSWIPKPATPSQPDLEAILKALLDKLLPKVIEEARDAARQQVIESLPAKRKR